MGYSDAAAPPLGTWTTMPMKSRVRLWGLVLLTVGLWEGTGHALEYKLQAGLVAYRWTEDFDQGIPREAGPMLTLGGGVSGAPSSMLPAVTLRAAAQFFVARVNYDTFPNRPPYFSIHTHSTYLGFKYEGDAGWRAVFGSVGVEPFAGLTYRWWLRRIESTQIVAGYPELYNTIYGRVGLRADHRFAPGSAAHAAFSIDPMLWAKERIDLSETVVDDGIGGLVRGEEVTVKNGKRPGWTVEAGVQSGTLDLTAYWQVTRVGKSPRVRCYQGTSLCHQPASDQDIIGLNLGVAF